MLHYNLLVNNLLFVCICVSVFMWFCVFLFVRLFACAHVVCLSIHPFTCSYLINLKQARANRWFRSFVQTIPQELEVHFLAAKSFIKQ